MRKGYFNIFVEKLLKKKGKLLGVEQIEKMLSDSMAENYTRAKGYKLVHLAKNRGFLVSLRKDLYYVPLAAGAIFIGSPIEPESDNEIIEKWYWEILYEHIKKYQNGSAIITGETALNIFLQNYEIPDTINLLTPGKQCVETIIRDKKAALKKMLLGKTSLFPLVKKKAKKVDIRKKSFWLTSIGISLLEALYANTENEMMTTELCKKVIRKYWKVLDWEEIVVFLRKGKYHTSMNKLYKIARGIDEKYAQHIMDIIKKHSYIISL